MKMVVLLLLCFLLVGCGYRGIDSLGEGDYEISSVSYYDFTRTYHSLVWGHAVNFVIYLPEETEGKEVWHLIPWEVEVITPEQKEYASIFRGADGRKHVRLCLYEDTVRGIKKEMREKMYWRGNPPQTGLPAEADI